VKNWETFNGHWEAGKGTDYMGGPLISAHIGGGPTFDYWPRVHHICEMLTASGDRRIVAICSSGLGIHAENPDGLFVYNNSTWDGTWLPHYGGLTYPYDTAAFGQYLVIADAHGKLMSWNAEGDFSTSVTEITDAPNASTIINFGDRIVAAGIDEHPLKLQWSVRNDHTDWTGVGSGYEELFGGAGAESDRLMKLVCVNDEVAVIFRERSLQHIIVTGIALTPFRFSRVEGGRGIIAPASAKNTPIGIVHVTEDNIYAYTLNGYTPIGNEVKTEILGAMYNHNLMQACYNPATLKYHLLVWQGASLPMMGSPATIYTFNLRENTWTRREYASTCGIQCLGVASDPSTGGTIDSLSGTIDNLSGTIDDLGRQAGFKRMLVLGTIGSGVMRETSSYTEDHYATFVATAVPSELRTMQLVGSSREKRVTVTSMEIEYTSSGATTLPLEYSLDNGVTWTAYGTFSLVATSKILITEIRKVIQSYNVMFRIVTTSLSDVKIFGLACTAIDAQPVVIK
jgi:hypothetical protein